MRNASDVQEILFDFTQRCFIGQKSSGELDSFDQGKLFALLSNGELTVMQVHQMSENDQRALRELLTQYIIFLEINPELQFPDNFLSDTTNMRLGDRLLEYICHYRWPFPQRLK